MRMRCKHGGKYWGKKGIKVCSEWDSFKVFEQWALSNGYNDTLTIDRIDNSKDYCPENCRWATYKEQANNTSKNRYVTIQGETHTITEWCNILNIVSKCTVYRRLREGWSEEDALMTPNVRKQGIWRLSQWTV